MLVVLCAIAAVLVVIMFSPDKKVDLSKILDYDNYKLSIYEASDVGCTKFDAQEANYYYLIDYKNNIEYFEKDSDSSIPIKIYNTKDEQIAWAKNKSDEIVWYRVPDSTVVEDDNYRIKIKNILRNVVKSELKEVGKEDNLIIYEITATESLLKNLNIVLDSNFELQDVLKVTIFVDEENIINRIELTIEEQNESEGFANNCYDYKLVFSDFNNIIINIPENIVSDNGIVGTYLTTITCPDGNTYDEKIVLTNNLERFAGKGVLLGDKNTISLMDCQNNQMINSSFDYEVEDSTLIITTNSEQYHFEIKDNSLIKKDSQEVFLRK